MSYIVDNMIKHMLTTPCLSNKNEIKLIKSNSIKFVQACREGDMLMAQMYIPLKRHTYMINKAFMYACRYGHYHIVKWLYAIKKSTIKKKFKNYASFRLACRHGHIDIAIFLKKIWNIDIFVQKNYIFRFLGLDMIYMKYKNDIFFKSLSNINKTKIWNNYVFHTCLKHGYTNKTLFMLRKYGTKYFFNDINSFKNCIMYESHIDCFELLINIIYKIIPDKDTFKKELIKFLIEKSKQKCDYRRYSCCILKILENEYTQSAEKTISINNFILLQLSTTCY